MAHKKQGGKASQHVSPEGKRLGVKVGNGQTVNAGTILVRQRGTKIRADKGVRVGRDHTLYAAHEGVTKFATKLGRKVISVLQQNG